MILVAEITRSPHLFRLQAQTAGRRMRTPYPTQQRDIGLPEGLTARLSLHLGLDAAALEGLAVVAAPFSVSAGQPIFRQGERATGMYVLDQGRVLIKARTPGDDALSMVELGAGEIFGELALLDDDDRSACASALTPASGWWISRAGFKGLLHSGQPVARDVMRRVQYQVAKRIRDTLARIAMSDNVVTPLRTPLAGSANWGSAEADFAPLLEAFSLPGSTLTPRWECLLDLGRRLDVTRGHIVGAEIRESPDFPLFWVIRGAVRECLPRGSHLEQIWVCGPGALAGVVGAVDGLPQPLVLQAAEDAIVLALPADCVQRLQGLDPSLAITMQELISRQIALAQRRINRHLGRAEGLRRFNQGEVD